MDRRTLLLSASAALVLPVAARAASMIEYTPGALKARMDAGETVLLDFSATWCSTCKAQERVIGKLQEANPAYLQNITFLRVDWDTYGSSELAKSLKIPRRSTLVAMKGGQELGRIVAGTRESQIRDLLDIALNAASA